MTPAWVGAGKGIPVGARMVVVVPDHDEVRSRSERSQMIALDVFEDGRWRVLQTLPEVIYLYRGADLIPDLTDPDTRAMYLRRLAIARGCPEDVASQGVIFYPSDGDYYDTSFFMKAGCAYATDAHHRPRGVEWRTSFKVGHAAFHAWDANPCLALALAWPADKRVTT